MHLYWSIHSSLSALPGHGNGPQCSPSHFGHIMDAIKLSQVSLSVNSALRQEIVEVLYEHVQKSSASHSPGLNCLCSTISSSA